jgi:5-methylthioribose kinase
MTMTEDLPFEALSVETLAARLGDHDALCAKIGKDTTRWKVREVGDGNLNLVFIVEGASGATSA